MIWLKVFRKKDTIKERKISREYWRHIMNLEEYFSIWNKLTKEQQNRLEQAAFPKKFEKGKLIQNGSKT